MGSTEDVSWSEEVAYQCSCGVQFRVERWRWVDVDLRPELGKTVRAQGPLQGTCPSCGREAIAPATWLEVRSSQERATLHISEALRADVGEVLVSHVRHTQTRPGVIGRWLLTPSLDFSKQSVTAEPAADRGVPTLVGDSSPPAKSRAPRGAYVGELFVDGDMVVLRAQVDGDARRLWGTAALRVRPVHLREYGYPLVGVRLIASYLGQVSLVDGVTDVGTSLADAVMIALSRDFRLKVVLSSDAGSAPVERDVEAAGLERNAALCLESARALLASGEYPPDAFGEGLEKLIEAPADKRLAPAQSRVSAGDYRYLVTPRETLGALQHLAELSQKANLAHLLEVDGFPVQEYEDLRKRILNASVEHGLCAPRRFWRRIIDSGLAEDIGAYARVLAANRHHYVDSGDDDLQEEELERSWRDILDLCQRKRLEVPRTVLEALDMAPIERLEPEPLSSRAGEIISVSERFVDELLDPAKRVLAANEALANREHIDEVLAVLPDFPKEDLLSVLPTVAELGDEAFPGLRGMLLADSAAHRQAAALVLSLRGAGEAIEPLAQTLFNETTEIWPDLAQSVGAFGASALRPLVRAMNRAYDQGRDDVQLRASRAMAAVILEDSVQPVRALLKHEDRQVVAAAKQALATLASVRHEVAQLRGEVSSAGIASERLFALRVWEAIAAPDLELLDDADIEII